MRSIFVAAMVGLLVPGTVPAFAQDRPLLIQPYDAPVPLDGPLFDPRVVGFGDPSTTLDALPTPFSHGGSCVKMCAEDRSPCDPDYWKVSDRRCNYNQRG